MTPWTEVFSDRKVRAFYNAEIHFARKTIAQAGGTLQTELSFIRQLLWREIFLAHALRILMRVTTKMCHSCATIFQLFYFYTQVLSCHV